MQTLQARPSTTLAPIHTHKPRQENLMVLSKGFLFLVLESDVNQCLRGFLFCAQAEA
jgi:hypothetical protein